MKNHCINSKLILPAVILILGLAYIFKSEINPYISYLPFLAVLICPISMFFMMKGMHNDHKDKDENN